MPIMVAVPHVSTRGGATLREAVLKMETPGGQWKELVSTEVTFDGYKVCARVVTLSHCSIHPSLRHSIPLRLFSLRRDS